MKLRNKQTGEIALIAIAPNHSRFTVIGKNSYLYDSLVELNDEWEDYEEPKKAYWYINEQGVVDEYPPSLLYRKGIIGNYKRIGNCFDTKEEAEKSVEKLKALTEAKEDGLKIKGYYYNHEDLVILADIGKCNKLTLDTLFGKEID